MYMYYILFVASFFSAFCEPWWFPFHVSNLGTPGRTPWRVQGPDIRVRSVPWLIDNGMDGKPKKMKQFVGLQYIKHGSISHCKLIIFSVLLLMFDVSIVWRLFQDPFGPSLVRLRIQKSLTDRVKPQRINSLGENRRAKAMFSSCAFSFYIKKLPFWIVLFWSSRLLLSISFFTWIFGSLSLAGLSGHKAIRLPSLLLDFRRRTPQHFGHQRRAGARSSTLCSPNIPRFGEAPVFGRPNMGNMIINIVQTHEIRRIFK